jgi:hypothetical protein
LKHDAYDSRFSRQKNCREGQGDEEKASDAKKKHLAPTKVKL